MGAVTITATIARSSLPDAAADPALRRLTSAQRPVLRAAIRRAATGPGGSVGAAGGACVSRAVCRRLEVDPTRFVPHGLLGVPALATLPFPPTGDAPVDLTAAGLPVPVPASVVRQLRDDTSVVCGGPHAAPGIARRRAHGGVLGERT